MVENVPEGEHVSHRHVFARGVLFNILLQRPVLFLREVPQARIEIERIKLSWIAGGDVDSLQDISALLCPMDHVLLESAAHDNN